VTAKIAEQLLKTPRRRNFSYPDLGPNTFPSHYQEAQHMESMPSATRADILTYRDNKRKSRGISPAPSPRSTHSMTSLSTRPPAIGTTLLDSDVRIFGNRSDKAETLINKLENSLLSTPTTGHPDSLRTKDQHWTYSDISKMFDEAKKSCLDDYVQLTKYREVTKATSDELQTKVAERLAQLRSELQQDIEDAAKAHDDAAATTAECDDVNPEQLKFSGEEIPSHVSPAALVRHRGPCG